MGRTTALTSLLSEPLDRVMHTRINDRTSACKVYLVVGGFFFLHSDVSVNGVLRLKLVGNALRVSPLEAEAPNTAAPPSKSNVPMDAANLPRIQRWDTSMFRWRAK